MFSFSFPFWLWMVNWNSFKVRHGISVDCSCLSSHVSHRVAILMDKGGGGGGEGSLTLIWIQFVFCFLPRRRGRDDLIPQSTTTTKNTSKIVSYFSTGYFSFPLLSLSLFLAVMVGIFSVKIGRWAGDAICLSGDSAEASTGGFAEGFRRNGSWN